jgi:hypothetical protein
MQLLPFAGALHQFVHQPFLLYLFFKWFRPTTL